MNEHKQLIAWLNDAYSMERSLTQVLENHTHDAGGFAEIHQREEQHLIETQGHAQQIERCLSILGEKPSTVKGMMGSAMGMIEGTAPGVFRDEIMKNVLMDYAAEHLEIACYRSLITAANELGQAEIARICEQILKEEEAMAEWIEQRLPEITRMSLHQTANV